MTRLSFVEMGRLGGEKHTFEFGHVKFEMTLQHLNESGIGLKTRNHYGYVRKIVISKRGASKLNLTCLVTPDPEICPWPCMSHLSLSFCINILVYYLVRLVSLWRSLTSFSCDFRGLVSITSIAGIGWAKLTADRRPLAFVLIQNWSLCLPAEFLFFLRGLLLSLPHLQYGDD